MRFGRVHRVKFFSYKAGVLSPNYPLGIVPVLCELFSDAWDFFKGMLVGMGQKTNLLSKIIIQSSSSAWDHVPVRM